MNDSLNGWGRAMTPVSEEGAAKLRAMTAGMPATGWERPFGPMHVSLGIHTDDVDTFDLVDDANRVLTVLRTREGQWYPVVFKDVLRRTRSQTVRAAEFRRGRLVKLDRVTQRELAARCEEWLAGIEVAKDGLAARS